MNFIASRLPIVKFLGTAGVLHYAFTIYSDAARQSVLTIQDYVSQNIKEKDSFSIIGVLKPRSIKLATGLNKKFVITDNVRELKCTYEGSLSAEFKQGETAIITGYCPDIKQKNSIIVKDYQTKHSMETREWETKNNVDKRSYGVESFK